MSASLLIDAEAKLASDHDGTYKEQLIALLEKHRDEFSFARQGFLPPEEYEVAEYMEGALGSALSIIRDHEAAKGDAAVGQSDDGTFSSMINV